MDRERVTGTCLAGASALAHLARSPRRALKVGRTYATVAALEGANQKRRIEEKTATVAPMGAMQQSS